MKRNIKISILIVLAALLTFVEINSQSAPAEDENIEYLVTFGADSDPSWGDDDFCQIFFFRIPESFGQVFYIRVYDPDTGGELDEMKGSFNTTIRFTVYGGPGTWTEEDAKGEDPSGNYESGNMLANRSFDVSSRYDKEWYTFGPFNPKEGEFVEVLGGYVFKIIAKGMEGDDGNLYSYYLSSDRKENRPLEGGNLFTYEYTFRLSNNQNNVSQIYPFLDNRVTSVRIRNYDWDSDGFIRVVSVAKRGELCPISSEANWEEIVLPIVESEHNTSMEVQFIKNRNKLIKNNNVAVIVQNQYGESLPFYVIPIGGIPIYNPSLRMKAVERKK